MQTAVIILAAGASLRLGQPKQLLQYNNRSFLENTITIAKAVTHNVVVVTGAHSCTIQQHLQGNVVQLLHNSNWQQGMASSIRCGLQHLMEHLPFLASVIVLLCDQPYIDEVHLHSLIKAHSAGENKIIASFYSGTAGVPALFPKSYFPDLLKLSGSEGARKIIADNLLKTVLIPFERAATDIDTLADYEQLQHNSGMPDFKPL